VYQPGANDGEVADPLAIEEGIGPMIMTVILVVLPRLQRTGGVVDAAIVAGGFTGLGRVCGQDRAAARKIEFDLALEAKREAEIVACGEDQRASACGGDGFDRLVDRGGIYGLAIAGAPKVRTLKRASVALACGSVGASAKETWPTVEARARGESFRMSRRAKGFIVGKILTGISTHGI